MPLEVPIPYNSEKIGKFSNKALKTLRIIIELLFILGLIYSIYNNKYIWAAGFSAAVLYIILERIREYKKKK